LCGLSEHVAKQNDGRSEVPMLLPRVCLQLANLNSQLISLSCHIAHFTIEILHVPHIIIEAELSLTYGLLMILNKIALLVDQLRVRAPDLQSSRLVNGALFPQEPFSKSTEGTHAAFLGLQLSGELVQESLNLIGHDQPRDLLLTLERYF